VKAHRRDFRLSWNQNGKPKIVVVSVAAIPSPLFSIWKARLLHSFARVSRRDGMHADEAASWDNLHERFEIKRINHQEAYSLDGACTNMAEEYVFRLRPAGIGSYHHNGAYLRSPKKSSWREDNRFVSNRDQMIASGRSKGRRPGLCRERHHRLWAFFGWR